MSMIFIMPYRWYCKGVLLQSFARSWHLLQSAEKRKLILATCIQSLLSVMDLIGVASLYLTTYLFTNGSLPKIEIFFYFNKFEPRSLAAALVILTISLFTVKGIVAPLYYSKVMNFLADITVKLSITLTKKFFSMPRTFIQKYNSQESVFALSQGVTAAINDVLGSAIILFSEFVLLASLIVITFLSNWVLTIFNLILFGLIIFFLNQFVDRRQTENTNNRIDSIISGNTLLIDMTLGYREIFVSNTLSFFLEEMNLKRNVESKAVAKGMVLNLLPKYVFEVGFYLCAGGVLFFLYNFTDQTEALAVFVLFLASGSRILPSILRIQSSLSNIRSNSVLGSRTFSLINDLDSLDSFKVIQDEEFRKIGNQELVFLKSVLFKYPESANWELVIDELIIPRNLKVAIVGPSGSGKSTLVDLILGVIKPNEGQVTLSKFSDSVHSDGRPLKIVYMPQQVSILNRSLRENIAFGVPLSEIDDELVLRSLSTAGLFDSISIFSEGIYTRMSENGSNLSGGQKQRIGFARLLYQNPDVIILDESTSSLDSQSEFSISKQLSNISNQLSIISIAHRLSTIVDYDLVIYMEEGRIKHMGTFDDVRAKSSSFNLQAKLQGI